MDLSWPAGKVNRLFPGFINPQKYPVLSYNQKPRYVRDLQRFVFAIIELYVIPAVGVVSYRI